MYWRPVFAAAASVDPLPAKGVEDQGPGFGCCFYEALQKRHGLLVGVDQAAVADLRAGDDVVRAFPGELKPALGSEDDDVVPGCELRLEVSHTVRLSIPHDDRLDRQAGEAQRVDEYLLDVPAAKTEYPPRDFKTRAAS